MEVGAWLRGLGLARYQAAFSDNEIDCEALPRLTAEDLKDLGVVLGGHRRKLLEAIAALRRESGAQRPAADQGASTPERRQLTVMFCDLVGSTALSARLDPEDLREVIGVCHAAVAEVIGRFDGFVAKYMGDGVLAYFGYPQAHEDDAERAVRAGLAVVGVVRRLPTPMPLQMRVGLATGLAVVGDLIGSGAAQERAVVGETPNLAARLQALAEPDAVVIGDSTRRLVGTSIALYNPPIRVAEEFAMLDVISGGRSWRAFRLPSRWTRLRLRPGCRPSCASDIPNRTTSSAAPGQRTNPFVFKWPLHQAAARQLPAEAKPHPPKFVPGPEDDPLWTLPSVLITPHTAGHGLYLDDWRYDIILDNCRPSLAGQPLRKLVDKAR